MLSFLIKQVGSRKDDIWLLSANWMTPVFSLIGGIVAARFLKPAEYGVVQAVMLIPLYSNFIQLGVFNGLNRNLPFYRGKGDNDKAQSYVDAAAMVARWVALVGIVIACLSVVLFLFRADNKLYAYLALFLIPALAFSPLKLQLETVYRGTRNFKRLGVNLHILNLWNLLLAVSTSVMGVTALAIRMGTQHLLAWLLFLRKPPLKPESKGTWKDARELSCVGMPMLINGMIFTWLSAADRTVIATFMTAEDLGYFALAAMAMNALRVFPNSINMLLYPRVAHDYGAFGSSRKLRRYIWIGLFLNLAVMIPIAIVGWFAVPILVTNFLPDYVAGIPAAQITVVGALAFAYSGPSVIVPILRRNLPIQIAGALAIALVWIGGAYAISEGFGIIGVAIARVAATGLYGLFVVGFVFYLTGQDIQPE